ncbi:MAG: helix-turn-helix domain-containing protein [Candidatus Methylacidiphilales bacterium]|nr:AraC family transcriptional regulator [Candidatus Methylacidiphilales bacterium]
MLLQFCFVSNNLRGTSVPMHTHHALELVYYVAGNGQSTAGERIWPVHRNALMVIPAGVLHDQVNRTNMTSICIGMQGSDLEPFAGLQEDTGGLIGPLMRSVLEEVKSKRPGFESIVKGILWELQGQVERVAAENQAPLRKEAIVHKALEIIRRHDGPLSVSDLANRLYISRDYLRHLFSEYAGQSPIRYILESRIDKARALLLDPNLRVGEVAERCGFENTYYFCRLFRKVTGQTPTEFRRGG